MSALLAAPSPVSLRIPSLRSLAVAAFALLTALGTVAPLPAADAPVKEPEKVDMAAMMARAKQFTTPGPEHEWLKRFLGEWTSELRITMPGAEGQPERGTMRGRWLIDGRWLTLEGEGSMMGMPVRTFLLIGYDKFKMSYVTSAVNSMDTALIHSEGDVDPKTGALLTYGTLDEYLTGEHDKMVKSVFRFPDADTIVWEVHDLPIGEANAKVFEIVYRRKSGAAK